MRAETWVLKGSDVGVQGEAHSSASEPQPSRGTECFACGVAGFRAVSPVSLSPCAVNCSISLIGLLLFESLPPRRAAVEGRAFRGGGELLLPAVSSQGVVHQLP